MKNQIFTLLALACFPFEGFATDPNLLWLVQLKQMNIYISASAITTDYQGNVYVAGNIKDLSAADFATPGAHQTHYGGGSKDAFVAKFSRQGQLRWATYYGGTIDDYASTVVCDRQGNVFIAGGSTSRNNISSPGSHQITSNGGDSEGFLVKFDSTGQRQWGTYYGGDKYDRPNYLVCDYSGNVYLAGETASENSIATPGSFQPTFGGGINGAFLVKFNPQGTRLWATYYGGNRRTYGLSAAYDSHGFVYMSGTTNSFDSIASMGAYQSQSGGLEDAFLAKFDSLGNRQWGTYYGGISNDAGYGVEVNGQGQVYITGQTSSVIGMATSGAYMEVKPGTSASSYLAQFTSGGQLVWGSYFGGNDGTVSTGSPSCDLTGDVYICGSTASITGIATPGCYQDSIIPGSKSSYLAKFSKTGQRVWATYYGLGDNFSAQEVRIDPLGNCLLTGVSRYGDSSYIAKFSPTPTGVQPVQPLESLQLYPNPASHKVNVEAHQAIRHIKLYSMEGVSIQVEAVHNTFSVVNLPPGLYTVIATTQSGKTLRQRLVVAR